METENSYAPNPVDLNVSPRSASYLSETRKWAFFLAIIGFIFLGLIVIMGFSFGTIMSSFGADSPMPFPSAVFGFFYLIIALIYFFPILFLYKFSTSIKEALQTKQSVALETAFKNLKNLYQYMGILMIIVLALYGLAIIGMIVGGSLLGL